MISFAVSFQKKVNQVKVTEYFENAAGQTLISFEILPPLKGGRMQAIFESLDPLMEFKPPFVDVTYHREEFIYKRKDSGYYEKTAIRKRPGTVGICAAIMHRYGVDAVPHLLCGGFSKEETENVLIDLNFLNIKNVLALRGDARKFETKFEPEADGHAYAIDMVKQISNMNQGKYLDPNIENGEHTDFCIGIAGYPEKHFEAPNMESDLYYAKKKVEAGADYIVTQMFFDNQKYFDFVKMCREAGIDVPIVPGLKPLTKKYQLSSIPRHFFIDLPEDLAKAMQEAKNAEGRKQVGIEWCAMQSKELKAAGVPCLHYYTMGDSDTIVKIVEQVY
ncbi:MAG: methylenetetrahydrofolate reductase [NAD(P)H] [Saprospiraceae bacterium]